MPTSFSMKINGLDSLVKNTKDVSSGMQSMFRQAMVKATTKVQNEAKAVKAGRFKNQTGTLRRSIQKQVTSPYRGIVYTDEKYGEYVEFGTRPRTIYPKNKKFLAFKINGKMVFAKKVNHKGSKPYPFMRPAFEGTKDDVEQIYADMAKTIVKELAK